MHVAYIENAMRRLRVLYNVSVVFVVFIVYVMCIVYDV